MELHHSAKTEKMTCYSYFLASPNLVQLSCRRMRSEPPQLLQHHLALTRVSSRLLVSHRSGSHGDADPPSFPFTPNPQGRRHDASGFRSPCTHSTTQASPLSSRSSSRPVPRAWKASFTCATSWSSYAGRSTQRNTPIGSGKFGYRLLTLPNRKAADVVGPGGPVGGSHPSV